MKGPCHFFPFLLTYILIHKGKNYQFSSEIPQLPVASCHKSECYWGKFMFVPGKNELHECQVRFCTTGSQRSFKPTSGIIQNSELCYKVDFPILRLIECEQLATGQNLWVVYSFAHPPCITVWSRKTQRQKTRYFFYTKVPQHPKKHLMVISSGTNSL